MAQAHEKFDPKAYMPAVASYYSDTRGRMLSMPFNSSTPVFFYRQGRVQEGGPRSEQAAQDLG